MMDYKEYISKGTEIANNSVEMVYYTWKTGLANLNWIQDQFENMARIQMDINKSMRADMVKAVEDFSAQTRQAQEKYNSMVKDVLQSIVEAGPSRLSQ